MSAKISKAFYVHCSDCHYQEFDFTKKDAVRHAESHECVKHLRREWNQAHPGVGDRFTITVEPKRAAQHDQQEDA